MNALKASAQARAWWGADGRVTEANDPTGPATRAAGKADYERLNAELKACNGVMTDKVKLQHLRRDRDRANGRQNAYRCRVGEVSSMAGFGMFMVHGQGDTFEEAFAAADKAGYGKGWKERYRAEQAKKKKRAAA